MMKTMTTAAAVIATLACAGSLQAHHSGSMYDTTPVWVKGTVVRFEPVDPHTIITLEGTGEDGEFRRWAIEGPGQSQLARLGIATDVPQVGDVIEFCAFPYKSSAELARIFPGVDFSGSRTSRNSDGSSPQFVAGHIMVKPEQERRLWNPHGVIVECIRSSEVQPRLWVRFLNSNARVRQNWCMQRGYTSVQSTASLRTLVDEVNSSIDTPCE